MPFAARMRAVVSGLCCPLVLGAAVLAGASAAFGAERYQLVDLGVGLSSGDTGKDVNNAGMAAFTISTEVFLYQNGVSSKLPGVAAGNGPLAMNDLGHLAGMNAARSYIYRDGVKTDLGSLGAVWPEGVAALDINVHDVVVGDGYIVSENAYRAFWWENGVLDKLPAPEGYNYGLGVDSSAVAVNDAGWAVGTFGRGVPRGQMPVLWKDGAGKVLPTLAGYTYLTPTDINNAGLIVGNAGGSVISTQAVIWRDGEPQLLGLLPGWPCSKVVDLNELGQAVGFAAYSGELSRQAVLFENGQVLDLNTLIPAGSGWRLVDANAINDAGWIVGTGFHGSTQHSYLLVPVPEPTSASLVFCVALLAGWRPRRA